MILDKNPTPTSRHPGRPGATAGGPALPGALLAGLVAGLALAGAPAKADDAPARHRACLDRAAEAPRAALDDARAWEAEGGGNAARHCAAVALEAAGEPGQAADIYRDLGRELAEIDPPFAAGLFDAAALALLAAERPQEAATLADRAVALAPGGTGYRITRAHVAMAQGDEWGAVDLLSAAIGDAPEHAGLYHLRAAVYRRLGVLALARDDIERALELAPDDPALYLERGNIRRLAGDLSGAAADWRRVARTAPGTPEGQAAGVNLQRLPEE